MFKLAVLSCLLAVVLSAPAEEPVAIISENNDIQPDGTFVWSYESADGSKQEQSGVPKPVEDTVVDVVEGSVSYSDPEGVKHELTYVADENGFQPQGADIPVTPEIPVQIARALKYLAEHPQKEEDKE